jgi:hypothetical protein
MPRQDTPYPTDPPPEPSRLSGIRGVSPALDEERPTGDDRKSYDSPFASLLAPVPLPRWLRPRRKD